MSFRIADAELHAVYWKDETCKSQHLELISWLAGHLAPVFSLYHSSCSLALNHDEIDRIMAVDYECEGSLIPIQLAVRGLQPQLSWKSLIASPWQGLTEIGRYGQHLMATP